MDTCVQGMGTIQEDEVEEQISRHLKEVRPQLVATECRLQHRDYSQLLRIAGARYGVGRRK